MCFAVTTGFVFGPGSDAGRNLGIGKQLARQRDYALDQIGFDPGCGGSRLRLHFGDELIEPPFASA